MNFSIREPLWGGRYVGLADHKIGPTNTIEILYRDSSGQRVYPGKYEMSGNALKKYPTQQFKANMPLLRMVPIADLRKL